MNLESDEKPRNELQYIHLASISTIILCESRFPVASPVKLFASHKIAHRVHEADEQVVSNIVNKRTVKQSQIELINIYKNTNICDV